MFKDAKLDELVNVYSKSNQTEKQSVYELLYPLYPTERERLEKIKEETNKYTDDDVLKNIENISDKTYFQGVENYIDYLYDDQNKSIFSYLPDNGIVVMSDISRLKERCENYLNEFKDNYNLNIITPPEYEEECEDDE